MDRVNGKELYAVPAPSALLTPSTIPPLGELPDDRQGFRPIALCLLAQERTMIGRLNHVAIAVKDLDDSAAVYRGRLGAEVSAPLPQPEHGVTVVFVTLPNTRIELLAPLGSTSPIAKFLERNP